MWAEQEWDASKWLYMDLVGKKAHYNFFALKSKQKNNLFKL